MGRAGEMSSDDHIAKLRSGAAAWNRWRSDKRERPDLRNWDFEQTRPRSPLGSVEEFDGFNFVGGDLHGISARNSIFVECVFDGCAINFADLCFSHFSRCSFVGVEMRVTKIGSATFHGCVFENSDLSYCSAEDTSFRGSRVHNCSFENMSLVNVDFGGADLGNVRVYGTSVWDVTLEGARQRDIVIGRAGDSSITVDNIELAQFIHLLITNARIREVIDTITSKVVLLLGRFTPERKRVLTGLRQYLRQKNYVPVVFDFAGPSGRDLTETIRTLAHLARFVIADLTDPRSVPHELAQIVPSLPSVPVHPIIAEGHQPFAMFEHYERYPWVLPVRPYSAERPELIAADVVEACEARLVARSDGTRS
jgi:uncharacterized protein YjbI with pentapeptide repeats